MKLKLTICLLVILMRVGFSVIISDLDTQLKKEVRVTDRVAT